MTDPERLIASGSDLERSLLLEAAAEKPSALLLAQMESGLGLAQTAAATSALGAKLVALVIGTALVGGGAVAVLGGEGTSSEVARAGVGAHLAARAEVASRTEPIQFLDPADSVKPAESVLGGNVERSPSKERVGRANPAESSPDRLSEEVALLDRARSALRVGDSAQAQRLLDTYERRFPAGVLAPEARKLRRSVDND